MKVYISLSFLYSPKTHQNTRHIHFGRVRTYLPPSSRLTRTHTHTHTHTHSSWPQRSLMHQPYRDWQQGTGGGQMTAASRGEKVNSDHFSLRHRSNHYDKLSRYHQLYRWQRLRRRWTVQDTASRLHQYCGAELQGCKRALRMPANHPAILRRILSISYLLRVVNIILYISWNTLWYFIQGRCSRTLEHIIFTIILDTSWLWGDARLV